MARTKQEYFTPTICNECLNNCKKELSLSLKEGFDNGGNKLFCPKFKKEKKDKKQNTKK